MQALLQDLRYGSRMLFRKPGFTLIAVITLALGIGVNTALFTVFDAFALKPLPLKDPDSLVNISGRDQRNQRQNLFSYLDYLDYSQRNTVFAGLVAWNKVAVPLGEAPAAAFDSSNLAGDSEYAFGQITSGNYFSVLGAEMALGRGFLPEEDRTPGTHPVVVLSHRFWQRHFDADPNIIGRIIKLQGHPFTVIGVTAREFIGTTPDTPSLWIPLMMRDQLIPAGGWVHARWFTDRHANAFTLMGRLRPGTSREQAQAQMSVIAQQLAEQFPHKDRTTSVVVKSGGTFVTVEAEFLPMILPLFMAFGLVLLIACANVANLLLARAVTRQKEIGVRLALGASRWRLIRQLLTESVLLAVLGGLAALLLTIWTIRVLYPVIIASQPIPAGMKEAFLLNLEPDYRIFLFALLVSLIAGVASGLTPAWQASRPDLTSALKDEGSTFGRHLSQSRLRNGLVVTQIAVCLTLLIGAGLLVRNLQALRTLDTGLETKNVFSVAVSSGSQSKDHRNELFLEKLRALPGVKYVSRAQRQPLTGASRLTAVTIPDGHSLNVGYNYVSPEYFDTLGVHLLRGRVFTEREGTSRARVVLISESTARRFWPGLIDVGEAVGKHVNIGPDAAPSFEVIGVTRDARSGWVWQKDESYLYIPLPRDDQSGEYILVRTAGDAGPVMAAVRSTAEAVGNLRISMRRVEDSLEYQMAPFRALAMLAGVLGMLALLLASIGLYGVMSFIVSQCTREIGIRVALGAESRDVVLMFVRRGLRQIIVGVVLGMIGGAAISRLLAAVLVDVSALDPIAFGGVSLCLTIVAMLACWIPARQAASVDPMIALRCD